MPLQCQICRNAENNSVHRAREMMFGMRETFDYLECATCGTLQIMKTPDLSAYYPPNYYAFNEKIEPNFARRFRSRITANLAARYFLDGKNPIGKYVVEKKPWTRREFPFALRQFNLGLDFHSRLLDFGCGAGRLLNLLRGFGFRNLTGADAFIEKDIFYQNGVKVYKKTLGELEPKFDLIMLHHSFEHLPNPVETLRESYRLLAKDKFCLIRTPVVSFAWEKYGVNWVQLDPPRHLFVYTEKSLQMLAEEAGFTVEQVIYDSESFQFWASEQYLRDIPLTDARSYHGDIAASIFTERQIADWEQQAQKLNAENRGDQACFYLRKP